MERSRLAASIMTTATLNGAFNSAPDTPSPVYPDRLIRPLPKRTMRSRLSLDAADSIFYPPAPAAIQLFHGVSTDSGDVENDSKVYVQQSVEHDCPDCNAERDFHHSYEDSIDFDSGDEDGPVVVRRSAGFRGASLSPTVSSSHPQRLPDNEEGSRQIKSASAGPDGYDAFENTNNKKKRKIPTPGNMGNNQSSLSPEFSAMGLATSAPSTPCAMAADTLTYYGAGNPASPVGSGISGSGRGRLGRQVPRSGSGRISLSIQTQIGFANGRLPIRRDGLLSFSGTTGYPAGKSDQGIISAAIANAAAVSSPPRGPGNVSLLDQQTNATTPTKTQFTFTCESDSSKGMAMQTQNTYPTQHISPISPLSAMAQNSRNFSTQGTQTSPSIAAQAHQQSQQPSQAQAQRQPQNHEGSGAEPGNTGRKKKRSPGSIYALAARQRKIQQQYANLHHPPSIEDLWICEFCEYESIFGRPPEALIRQYEIKDRKERKRLAEKKRLLEKAKMKGRKNRKATKNANKNAAAHHPADQPGYDRASVDHSSVGGSGGGHEDDYNEYDEEPVPVPGPPPASFKPPLPPERQPKIPANLTVSPGAIDLETHPPP